MRSARWLVACAALLWAIPAFAQNVVVVLFDDLGIDKVCAYSPGSCGFTPTLDAIATAGVKFNHLTVNSLCSPTRASFLSGTHSFRHGVGNVVEPLSPSDPDQTVGLDAELPNNLPKSLKADGYRTAVIGKWHLASVDGDVNPATHPLRTGFDYFSVQIGGAGQSISGFPTSGYNNYELCDNGVCTQQLTPYLTTRQVDAAIAQLSGSEPFFVYLALSAPHVPLHCPPTALHSYGATCSGGAIVQHKAMIQAADTELGRLVAAMDLADTTLIVFGDNGTLGSVVEAPFNPAHAKGTLYRGGVRVPLLVRGQAVQPGAVGGESDALIQVADLAATVLDIAGTSSPAFRDGISALPYLTTPTLASIRTTSFAQLFLPNSHPAAPNAALLHERVAEDGTYRLIQFSNETLEMYDEVADPHEATPLNLGALTAPQQAAYDILIEVVNFPESKGSRVGSHRHAP